MTAAVIHDASIDRNEQLELLHVRPKKVRYPLEITEAYYNECDTGSYFSKGHHPVDKFVRALSAYMDYDGAELLGFFGDKPLESQVEHQIWRTVPDGDLEFRYVESEPGRGAFPVTVIEVY